jgi:VIT1/CCC1 family predicted Fe2+/Mn2+ transporter
VGTDLPAALTRAGWAAGRASFTVALPAFGCVLAAGTRLRGGSRWRARAKTAGVMVALLTSMLSPMAGLMSC